MRYTDFSIPAEELAKRLVGKRLCCDGIDDFTIIETEAYPHDDSACYGKTKTKDNKYLFEKGGTCCILGGMLLISCGAENTPENVLIRGIANDKEYINGPYNTVKMLKLEKSRVNGKSLLDEAFELSIEDDGHNPKICRTVRKNLSANVTESDKEKSLNFKAY